MNAVWRKKLSRSADESVTWRNFSVRVPTKPAAHVSGDCRMTSPCIGSLKAGPLTTWTVRRSWLSELRLPIVASSVQATQRARAARTISCSFFGPNASVSVSQLSTQWRTSSRSLSSMANVTLPSRWSVSFCEPCRLRRRFYGATLRLNLKRTLCRSSSRVSSSGPPRCLQTVGTIGHVNAPAHEGLPLPQEDC